MANRKRVKKKTFLSSCKDDKYHLPAINSMLFVAIASLIVLFTLGKTFALIAVIFGAAGAHVSKFSGNTLGYLTDQFKGLALSTHLVILIAQLIVLTCIFGWGRSRNKIWKTIADLTV